MSRKEDPDDVECDTMDEFLNKHDNTPAIPEPRDEQLMEEWDEADPEDYLPTIPGTAILDTVQGSVYLWDCQCNEGLQYDGELMEREDAEFSNAKA